MFRDMTNPNTIALIWQEGAYTETESSMLLLTTDASMPTMPTDLGTLIANERERLKWSLRDVTAHGGPRHNTVSYIETGKVKKPDAETLWRIAVAFATPEGAEDVGKWFARLLRVAGYPLDAEADAVVAKLASVLSSERRQQILRMTPEQLDTLLSLYASLHGGDKPPQ